MARPMQKLILRLAALTLFGLASYFIQPLFIDGTISALTIKIAVFVILSLSVILDERSNNKVSYKKVAELRFVQSAVFVYLLFLSILTYNALTQGKDINRLTSDPFLLFQLLAPVYALLFYGKFKLETCTKEQ